MTTRQLLLIILVVLGLLFGWAGLLLWNGESARVATDWLGSSLAGLAAISIVAFVFFVRQGDE